MTSVDFAAFDCDNHYYEAEDAFTRHMEPEFAKRTMQWAEINGKKRLLVGGAINRFIPNPTFNPIARPGSLDDYFRGKVAAADIREAFGELEQLSDRPEYRDRDKRLELMDKQNLDACLLFPTLGVGMESAMKNDLPAMRSAFRAFNRWMEEDWGFAYKDRLYSAAYITLSDVDNAVAELQWALDRGCRVVNLRASAVMTDEQGNFGLGDPRHDPFWALANEAGISVCFHAGDTGYGFLFEHWGLDAEFEAFRYNPLRSLLLHSGVADTMASLLATNTFSRFPNLRMATIESGSSWVGPLFQRLGKAWKQHKHAFEQDPREAFKQHVSVAPYYEDDIPELKELIGADRVLFGSDYPHAEGLANPIAFAEDLEGFSADEIKLVMHDNGRALVS